jgi:hypothetical protein
MPVLDLLPLFLVGRVRSLGLLYDLLIVRAHVQPFFQRRVILLFL